MEGAMAGGMAGRADEANAGRDFGLALHLADVFPVRERYLNAPRQSLSCLRQPIDHARIGPEFVLDVRDDDLGVWIERFGGVLLHQSKNGVGMEMRDENTID